MNNEITTALSSDTPLPFARCNELLAQARKRDSEIKQRVNQIRPAHTSKQIFGTGLGPERARALETGTSKDISRLDDECQRLASELERLQVQIDVLGKRQKEARGREAAERLAGRYADLDRRLTDVESAQRALADAWQIADEAYQAAFQDRGIANNAGHKLASADSKTLQLAFRVASGPCNIKCNLHNLAAARHSMFGDHLGIDMRQAVA